ncbi:hypothetical protein BGZ63DRAFT_169041 [Mariannaea sp. PMI_226]|nr:hypothetical protein BGZ63DRAFT_169041 [Mariannaea sp. PMI_226]
MSNPHAMKLRRLNGRLQACDPCRKRKIACDHGQPVCQRCSKRKLDRHCIYTISAHSVSPMKTTSSTRIISNRQGTTSNSIHFLDVEKSEVIEKSSPSSNPPPNSRAPGYLGFASYSTVIEEARQSLPAPLIESGKSIETRSDAVSHLSISPMMLDSCVAVLQQIPTSDNSRILSDTECPISYFIIHRIVKAVLDSLYDPWVFGNQLGKQRDTKSLKEMALIVCANTAKPVLDDVSDGADWMSQFTSRNIRWESIGLLLAFWHATNLIHHPRHGTSLHHQTTREDAWPKTLENVSHCIAMCHQLSNGNALLVYLHHMRRSLESMSSGDASQKTWKFHAETVACLTFLGYHAETSREPYIPSLATELKRIVFAHVYSIDKSLASFTGRPPLLPRTFTTTPIPLDLDNDYFFGGQNNFGTQAPSSFDERGWSTEGLHSAATCLRARSMLASIREEIFEIALKKRQRVSVDNLLEIKMRHANMVAGFPNSLIHTSDAIYNPEVELEKVFATLLIRMEALLNEFFLSRLLIKMGHDAQADLLLTGFDLVSLTLELWTNFERFATLKRDFEWILMAYGATAGGVLCQELQNPSFYGRHPQDHRITRSQIIQKLSLLVGFLDWVDPLAPNANLCADCKSVIELVLDQALNYNPEGTGVASPLGHDFPSHLDFGFDLLDSFDWLTTES